ncbi:FGGY-family carbohydrate kinase [Halanaerobium kushneri]|uniref:Sugar (Pentulose or hexulose) kinase n=1 Tax=Halanaerobium kushneri TaxID=56779 RepID=A0A1N6RZM4_9FIRM|nr:FGGY-family carbohydrate kinase [Halanaerobium kushneri]SIQ34300.1 Sugar (pentulose or hexulose) kinase [Halanaerobium kushneri]
MSKYILGIDQGTQSTKVTIFDTLGHKIVSHTEQLREIQLGDNGEALHPDDDLWTSLKETCNKVFEKFEGNKDDIIGVGLLSIRCCRALLKENGELASPVQSWMDIRLSRPYEPEDDEVRYCTTTTGYLTHRLTGETKDTRSNYVGPWPIDPENLEWFEDEEKYTTPRDMLFELVDPATVLGEVTAEASKLTGIPAGIPVVSTSNDKAVEGLGAGITDDGTVLVSLGTYITSMMMGDEYDSEPENYFTNPGATPGEFLYESSGIRRGMSTVTWIKDLLGSDVIEEAEKRDISPENYLNMLAEDIPAGSNGLYTVLHWLPRPNKQHERGIMIGFNGTHKGPHMFRSILEGIALTMYNNSQAMCDELDIDLNEIVVSGGGSKGDLFMQIFSDIYGVPAHRNEVNGAAGLGSAICAALALDVYDSREEAIEKMVRHEDTFTPDLETHEFYQEINEKVYKHIPQHNEQLLKKSHNILNEE